MAAAAEERHDVIDIAPRGPQVDEQRRMAVEPEGAGRHEGPLDTMRLVLPKHPDDRQGGGTVGLMIPVETADEILDPFRRAQPGQPGRHRPGQPDIDT
jgi:hypothetical protein